MKKFYIRPRITRLLGKAQQLDANSQNVSPNCKQPLPEFKNQVEGVGVKWLQYFASKRAQRTKLKKLEDSLSLQNSPRIYTVDNVRHSLESQYNYTMDDVHRSMDNVRRSDTMDDERSGIDTVRSSCIAQIVRRSMDSAWTSPRESTRLSLPLPQISKKIPNIAIQPKQILRNKNSTANKIREVTCEKSTSPFQAEICPWETWGDHPDSLQSP